MFKIEKLDLLIALYIFCVAVSELMGAKTFAVFTLFGYTVNQSVSLFVFPLIFTINDIITEVYGAERTRSIIRSSLLVVVLLFGYSLLATNLPPSHRFLPSEGAYDEVFGLSARFSFASLVAFIASDFSDVYIFTKLREKMGKNGLWLRNNVSNIISQFFDTIVFMVIAFWSFSEPTTSNLAFITGITIPYLLAKWAISIIETPLVYLGVTWLKTDKK